MDTVHNSKLKVLEVGRPTISETVLQLQPSTSNLQSTHCLLGNLCFQIGIEMKTFI